MKDDSFEDPKDDRLSVAANRILRIHDVQEDFFPLIHSYLDDHAPNFRGVAKPTIYIGNLGDPTGKLDDLAWCEWKEGDPWDTPQIKREVGTITEWSSKWNYGQLQWIEAKFGEDTHRFSLGDTHPDKVFDLTTSFCEALQKHAYKMYEEQERNAEETPMQASVYAGTRRSKQTRTRRTRRHQNEAQPVEDNVQTLEECQAHVVVLSNDRVALEKRLEKSDRDLTESQKAIEECRAHIDTLESHCNAIASEVFDTLGAEKAPYCAQLLDYSNGDIEYRDIDSLPSVAGDPARLSDLRAFVRGQWPWS